MIAIRAGMGLGDAIYLQSVARHFVRQGHQVEACTPWVDVFRPLGDKVKVSPFRRENIDRLAHYSMRRERKETTQFQDCCIQAGIREPVDLQLDWKPVNTAYIARLKAKGWPLVCVQMPRAPFGRSDGYGMELLPRWQTVQKAIDRLKGKALVVQVGQGEPLHRFSGIHIDLVNKTSVSDLLDVAYACDVFLGYCSFIVPLAEALCAPSLIVWSRRGLQSPTPLIRTITPQKIFFRATSQFVMDDCSEDELAKAVDALCDKVGSQRALCG